MEIENYRDRCNKERRDVTIYRDGRLGSKNRPIYQPTVDIISMTHTASFRQRLTLLKGKLFYKHNRDKLVDVTETVPWLMM